MPSFYREVEVDFDIDDILDLMTSYDMKQLLESYEDDDLLSLLGEERLQGLCDHARFPARDPETEVDLDEAAHELIKAGAAQLRALPDNTLAQLLHSLTPALCDLTKEIEAKGYLPPGLLQELKLLSGC
jgi:hypothetical protein